MPAAFATPALAAMTSTLVGAGATAVGSIYGANKASSASRDATAATERSTAEALALERENEQRRREEFDRTEAENRRRYDEATALEKERYAQERERLLADDAFTRTKYSREENRRTPYRVSSVAALNQLNELAGLGIAFKPSSMASLASRVEGV